MFASHGFQNVAERAKLGQYLLKRFLPEEEHIEKLSVPERLRICFEQLGPTFIKLGQLLATRPDLVPQDFVDEFQKLHDRVRPVAFEEIEPLLTEQYGNLSDVFLKFEQTPIASASIAQVHRATLLDGEEVVVKVQRPGLVEIINDDLIVLYNIAGLLERYVPETRVFKPTEIVDEFFKTLELETNFEIEANNIERFTRNFAGDPQIVIPKVYLELSGPQTLVMEAMSGRTLSQAHNHMLQERRANDDDSSQVTEDPRAMVKLGLRTFFKMVFNDRFFHGDLHAGNIFLLPGNQIGLIDFGVVGRLSEKTRDSIADMMVALATENYHRFTETFLDLAPYNEDIDADRFARSLRDLIAPHFGMSFKKVNLGRLLMDSTAIAARYKVSVPSELMLFFKAVVTVEGMGRLIIDDFDILEFAQEFSVEIMKAKYDPERMARDLFALGQESTSLLYSLPRQLRQALRKWNHPGHASKVQVVGFEEFERTVTRSASLIFLGFLIGSLLLTGAVIMHVPNQPLILGLPSIATGAFLTALGLSLIAFYRYIRR